MRAISTIMEVVEEGPLHIGRCLSRFCAVQLTDFVESSMKSRSGCMLARTS